MIAAESLEQGSAEWRQARCGVVTASNFKLVLTKGRGKTRKNYMRRLVQEIMSGEPEEPTYWSGAMMRGTELEPHARRAYESASTHTVREVGLVFLNSDRRIGASPDGLIGNDGGLEIKCPLPHTHDKYLGDGRVPAIYKPQIQGNLWITGRKWWDFVSFAPERTHHERIIIHRMQRDEDYITRLRIEVERFVRELDDVVERM